MVLIPAQWYHIFATRPRLSFYGIIPERRALGNGVEMAAIQMAFPVKRRRCNHLELRENGFDPRVDLAAWEPSGRHELPPASRLRQ